MRVSRLTILINRAMAKEITEAEREELLALLADRRNKKQVEAHYRDAWDRFKPQNPVFSQQEGDAFLQRILDTYRVDKIAEVGLRRRPNKWRWASVAAATIIGLTLILYFVQFEGYRQSQELTLAEAVEQAGIIPGRDQATITLGDGRIVVLDDVDSGLLADNAGTQIHKLSDGEISYEQSSYAQNQPVTYNTIHVPKGGQYKLVLPDGTKVHLNSESTLNYPTRFDAELREVSLTGEAYFDVAHQYRGHGQRIPFIVYTPKQQVEVLGTIFNIRAYDEVIKTTLVEGRVQVTATAGTTVVLNPGEAATHRGGMDIAVTKVNVDEELAWHNGYFIFNDEPIQSIMQRVSRWYDVEVNFEGDMTDKRFGGIFQRSKSIAQLLESFKTTGLVDFKIVERRVIVTEK